MAEKKSAEKKAENKKLKITLVKSTIGRLEKQKRTVKALGLKKIGSVVVKEDTPAMRGMVFVVQKQKKVYR